MTENSLILLYCIIDDFIQRFIETSAGKKNVALYYGKRGPKLFYLDSTPLSVCENRYICSHKVMKDIASRGKSTKGWFFGFKLKDRDFSSEKKQRKSGIQSEKREKRGM